LAALFNFSNMNTSVIRYRVADFLRRHAPFDALAEQDLLEIAGRGRVKFHEADEFIFRQGQPVAPWVWVIQRGKVEILDESQGSGQLRDVLGEGDLLGLDRFAGSTTYVSSARTAGDVLLYAIEAGGFEELALQAPALKRYLAAHFSVSSVGMGRRSWLDADAPNLEFLEARYSRIANGRNGLPSIETKFTTRAALRKMMGTGSDALAVDQTAILTAADLALFCDRNPLVLLGEIRHASCAAELAPLLRQGERMVLDGLAHSPDVDDCAMIANKIIQAAMEACLHLAQREAITAGIEPPKDAFCWMGFGALARGEILRLEPPQLGLICAGDASSIYLDAMVERTEASFHGCLGVETRPRPNGVKSFVSINDWKAFFQTIIREPLRHDLYACCELFDFCALSGDAALTAELKDYIAAEINRSGVLVPLLANDTLAHLPPITVFRGLVLDSEGMEQESLDLAKFVLHPISDAARVFVAGKPGAPMNTIDRLDLAAREYPDHGDVFRDAAGAFRIAAFHCAVAGTPLIDPSILGKHDQRAMKTAFSAILRLLELTSATFLTT
jgi:signal-transduction protein with cAMP-binding, CBS, and nucleotidyltransferase domain